MAIEFEIATEENFNEIAYILANPDIGIVIMNGGVVSAWDHFSRYGKQEGRKQLKTKYNQRVLDGRYLAKDVPDATLAKHSTQFSLLLNFCKPGNRILEIGSRCVTSQESGLRRAASEVGAEYIGVDYYEGLNVDICCDAHKLANYVDGSFDLVYSSAVFEHLAMPWLVAEEIGKVLKVGGCVFIETHFSWKSHERPWHFFQFSDMALRSLFSPAMGFECIDAGVSNPLVARFSSLADDYLRYRPVPKMYCHSSYFGKKVRDVSEFDWRTADMSQVVDGTQYPKPDGSPTLENQ